ncbi:MAG: septum formation initiator family protein [Clostridia bacterium]|nr:septum formation initiator family protein [Clostridia bacterium]
MAVRNINEAKPKKKKFRKVHFLWIILVLGAVVFVFASLAQNFIEYGQLKDEINDINQEITELDKESNEIQAILDDETHDEYFEKIAREEYGYCKPGEKVYYNSSFGE